MPLTRYEPFLAQGGKIDPISEIRNAGIITSGDVYWVSNESDGQHRARTDSLGRGVVKTSIQAGIDATLADQDDYVLVVPQDANASWAPGTAVDMNKRKVHLVSVGYGKSVHGYTNTIEGYAVTAMDDEIVHVTQEGCEIAGFRILGTAGTGSGGTLDNGLLYLSGSALNLWVHDCEITATGAQWDDDGFTGMVASADDQHGLRMDNVAVGGTVAEASGSQLPVAQGAESQNWEFHDCKFWMLAGNTGQEFVSAGTGNIDYFLINRCQFINLDQGNAVASAVTGNVTDDEGVVHINYCSGVNVTELGTDDNAWISPAASGTLNSVYDPGIAIGTAMVTAA